MSRQSVTQITTTIIISSSIIIIQLQFFDCFTLLILYDSF